MKVYRIVRKKYQDDLSGTGARIYGGRWNKEGTSALYTSVSRSLCVLELLVHTPKDLVPPSLILLTIEIPDKLLGKVESIDQSDLPKDWRSALAPDELQVLGSSLLAREDCFAIKVPSVIIPEEHNFVFNPEHSKFKTVRLIDKEKFSLDDRLV